MGGGLLLGTDVAGVFYSSSEIDYVNFCIKNSFLWIYLFTKYHYKLLENIYLYANN